MMDLLGWGEWVVIAILALIIVGPKDLPRIFYALGQWTRRLRESTAGIREEFEGLMRLEHIKAYQENEEKEGKSLSSEIDLLPFPSVHEKPTKRSTRRRKSA